jgi:hypothetical protein
MYQHLLHLALRAAKGEPAEDWTPEIRLGLSGRIPPGQRTEAVLDLAPQRLDLARIAQAQQAGVEAEADLEALITLARLRTGCFALGIARLNGGPQGVAADLRPRLDLARIAQAQQAGVEAEADLGLRDVVGRDAAGEPARRRRPRRREPGGSRQADRARPVPAPAPPRPACRGRGGSRAPGCSRAGCGRRGRGGSPASSPRPARDRLGAGFAISARDLDLRGAGDLVGESQAGHVKLRQRLVRPGEEVGDAPALAAPDPAAELVQLRQPEALGVELPASRSRPATSTCAAPATSSARARRVTSS